MCYVYAVKNKLPTISNPFLRNNCLKRFKVYLKTNFNLKS